MLRLLDRILTALTTIVAVLLVAWIMKRYNDPLKPRLRSTPALGSLVKLPGVDWPSDRRTLVFVLQSGCSYCRASVGFYRELLRGNSGQKFHTLAVMPEPVKEATAYINAHMLPIDDVREADLGELKIVGTPTLLLVGSDGRVEARWIGKLSRAVEDEVFARLGISRTIDTSSVSANELEHPAADRWLKLTISEMYRLHTRMPVIDVRDRPEFDRSHVAGSVNIPVDELEARGPHEVPRNRDIIVYCNSRPECAVSVRSQGVPSRCDLGVIMLRRIGRLRIRVIDAGPEELSAAGIQMVRSSAVGN